MKMKRFQFESVRQSERPLHTIQKLLSGSYRIYDLYCLLRHIEAKVSPRQAQQSASFVPVSKTTEEPGLFSCLTPASRQARCIYRLQVSDNLQERSLNVCKLHVVQSAEDSGIDSHCSLLEGKKD